MHALIYCIVKCIGNHINHIMNFKGNTILSHLSNPNDQMAKLSLEGNSRV